MSRPPQLSLPGLDEMTLERVALDARSLELMEYHRAWERRERESTRRRMLARGSSRRGKAWFTCRAADDRVWPRATLQPLWAMVAARAVPQAKQRMQRRARLYLRRM